MGGQINSSPATLAHHQGRTHKWAPGAHCFYGDQISIWPLAAITSTSSTQAKTFASTAQRARKNRGTADEPAAPLESQSPARRGRSSSEDSEPDELDDGFEDPFAAPTRSAINRQQEHQEEREATPQSPLTDFLTAIAVPLLPLGALDLFRELSNPDQQAALMTTMAAIAARGHDGPNPNATPNQRVGNGPEANGPVDLAEEIRQFQYSLAAKDSPGEFCSSSHRGLCPRQPGKFIIPTCPGENTQYIYPPMPLNLIDPALPAMQLKRQLRRQTPAVLEVHFPPGFINEDHDAVQHANTAIRTQLKQVRNKFRNHLMTGFSPTGDPTLPNIPNLQNLSRIMWRHLNPALAGTPDGEIDRLVSDPQIRVRYAFLRLGTLQNYYDPKSCNISQWLQIDRKLISNCTLAVDYTNA
ncbi:hypothetical protein PtB15_10B560 [Puccinia triticina]|nr:hypothetical protein PtB15_10B560 [Puccinia triticina]